MTTATIPAHTATGVLGDLAAAYGLTARLVLAPADRSLLRELSESGVLDRWAMCPSSETIRGISSLRRSLAVGEDLAMLAAEYDRLFTDGLSLVPLPYESAYRPAESPLSDLPVVPTLGTPHLFGLQDPPSSRRDDGCLECDHLGLELLRAGRLCLAASEAFEHGDAVTSAECLVAHHDLLERHLLRWAPGCLREVEAAADTQFYRGWAALGLGVLGHAHTRLP
ncbi:MAG: putative dimethyl sulfoxide reductase chaperone [Actinomycetota bacterium]|nr:putative dimethyl sulfoxide reductase chaperone [Actinomycetota bacterium]